MEKKVRKQQSFIHGAAILVGSTMLVKVISAIFKIPLANLIGGVGMGVFSSAYDLYLPIYALAMAGLPIAISRIVSEQISQKRYKDVRQTLKVAKRAFWVTGLTGFVIMLILSYPYTLNIKDTRALLAILCTAPAILFCCIMSSYRGYYEGLRNMFPTAISSVIEALGKLFLGFGFAYFVIKYAENEVAQKGTAFGHIIDVSASAAEMRADILTAAAPYSAAAAVLGITLGTAFGALYLVIRHKTKGDMITAEELVSSEEPISTKKCLKLIISISIPVVLGSLVTNIASLVDAFMVQNQLANVIAESGEVLREGYKGKIDPGITNADLKTFLYGCYKGYALNIYNLIPTITSALGISALPTLAAAWVKKDKGEIKGSIESIMRITAFITLPAAMGIVFLSGNIMDLLYPGAPGEAQIAAPLLTTLGYTAIFSGLMMPITNMLQAIGRQDIPVKNIAIGAILKVVVNYVLVGQPEINIKGAAIGTLCCYVYIYIANLICFIKFSKTTPNFISVLIKPLAAALLCGGSAAAAVWLLKGTLGNNIATVSAIVVAVVVYVAALLILRAVSREDVMSLPKGQKIAEIMDKMKLLSK